MFLQSLSSTCIYFATNFLFQGTVACFYLESSNSSLFFLYMIFNALDDDPEYLRKDFLELCDDLFSETAATGFSSCDCSLNQTRSISHE